MQAPVFRMALALSRAPSVNLFPAADTDGHGERSSPLATPANPGPAGHGIADVRCSPRRRPGSPSCGPPDQCRWRAWTVRRKLTLVSLPSRETVISAGLVLEMTLPRRITWRRSARSRTASIGSAAASTTMSA